VWGRIILHQVRPDQPQRQRGALIQDSKQARLWARGTRGENQRQDRHQPRLVGQRGHHRHDGQTHLIELDCVVVDLDGHHLLLSSTQFVSVQ